MHFRSLLFSALVLISGAATAQDTPLPDVIGPAISRFEAGIICAPEVVGFREAPDTVAGVTNIIDSEPDFVSTGRYVPAVEGMGFGVKTHGRGVDLIGVTVTTTHPPMGAEGITQQTYVRDMSGFGPAIVLYQFDYPYELVLGRWTFTAEHEGEILFRASFTVVPPEAVPSLAGVCGYEELLG
ncbi:DUF3859 domain-containing protein [Loktanella sp. IMCC34160]|uniref:DUF3859 domain-containing protein n=1 Tax=Loktanella sp. IMCC34160 TaxID=2510646 RepID=UPI00101CEBFD|nr:DUF3859 domain-containing protein [Loktanella sp. IMCC34160]RYG91598.1 DUF3859 domain-containing protein [Loktanella sp. IMCC34160]